MLQENLGGCIASVAALRQDAEALAQHLDLEGPVRVKAAEWLLETACQLQCCPGVEKQSILGADLNEIGSETEHYQHLSNIHAENRKVLDSLYTGPYLSLPSDLCDRLRQAEDLASVVKRSLEDDATFIANRASMLEWAQDFAKRADIQTRKPLE